MKRRQQWQKKETKPTMQAVSDVVSPVVAQSDSSSSQIPAISDSAADGPVLQSDLTSKDYYFDSYAHYGIHEEMLKDERRTRAYLDAISQNSRLFRGKIVLDVGCGTGILSMFAIQAGAAHCYGVDMSSIITQAQQIIDENGYSNKITLIRGKVEEIELPVPQVDIIISEWMGYFLFYESMLQTVLFARDKWLNKETGSIYPSSATLSIAACSDSEYYSNKINYWNNVYGFKMSCIRQLALQEPLVDSIRPSQLLSSACDLVSIDLRTVTEQQVSEFNCNFALNCTEPGNVDCLVSWFTVHFPGHISLSTAPYFRSTHWQQTIFYLNDKFAVNSGTVLNGVLKSSLNSGNHRDMDIRIELEGNVQDYKLR